jgi:hypothetical protein
MFAIGFISGVLFLMAFRKIIYNIEKRYLQQIEKYNQDHE